jgi:2-dehydropantoate 2-reductase
LSVSLEGPASVRQETNTGGIALAPTHDPGAVAPVAAALRAAGIAVPILPDYRAMKWSKLLLNMLANATAAIVALPPSAIYADPQLFRIERAAFREALRVMQATGLRPVRLPGFNVPLLARAMRLPAPLARRLVGPRAAQGRGDKRPSLWLDIERGREQTEIAWLNGAIARAGAERGVPAPVNARLAEIVNDVACDPDRRALFARRPDRLVQALYQG